MTLTEHSDDVVHVPITDRFDLHPFRPQDIGSVVREYLREAAAKGFTRVVLIHGKGKGVLRRTVHAVLAKHPLVAGYEMAGERGGQWGATVATLRLEVPATGDEGSAP